MQKLCKVFRNCKLVCYVVWDGKTDTYYCLQKARAYFNDYNHINSTQIFDDGYDTFDENIPILGLED